MKPPKHDARVEKSAREPAQVGDAPAGHAPEIARLFERHYASLVGFLVNRLQDEAEANEVAQEAYYRLLQLDRLNTVSFLRAYLYRTALNISTERARRRSLSQRFDGSFSSEDLTDERSPERALGGEQALDIVRQALLELPAGYRRALLRRRIDDASTAELCQELGLKSSQVRLYLRRAVAYCQFRVMGMAPDTAREQAFK